MDIEIGVGGRETSSRVSVVEMVIVVARLSECEKEKEKQRWCAHTHRLRLV